MSSLGSNQRAVAPLGPRIVLWCKLSVRTPTEPKQKKQRGGVPNPSGALRAINGPKGTYPRRMVLSLVTRCRSRNRFRGRAPSSGSKASCGMAKTPLGVYPFWRLPFSPGLLRACGYGSNIRREPSFEGPLFWGREPKTKPPKLNEY